MSENAVGANQTALQVVESAMYKSKVVCYQDRLDITAPSNMKGFLSAPALMWLFGKSKTSTIPLKDLRTVFFSLYAQNGQVRYEAKFCPALADDILFSGLGRTQTLQVVALFELISRLNGEVEFYFEDRTGMYGAFKSSVVRWG